MSEKIAALLGFLTLFNIVSAIQNFVTFSASYVWLSEWWRYYSSFIFWPLPIDLSRLEKDLWTIGIVIFGLALRYTLSNLGAFKSWSDANSAVRLIYSDHAEMMRRYGAHTFGMIEVLYVQVFVLIVLALGSLVLRISLGMPENEFFLSNKSVMVAHVAMTFSAGSLMMVLRNERKYRPKSLNGPVSPDFLERAAQAFFVFLMLPYAAIVAIVGLFMAGFVQSFPNARRLAKYLLFFVLFLLIGFIGEVYLDPYLSEELNGWPRAPQPV